MTDTRDGRAMPIKVMADYGCHPLWWDSTHPDWPAFDRLGDIDPATLGLSPALLEAFETWARTHDAVLDDDDPAGSDFPTPEAEEAFEAEGRALALRLAEELGPRAHVRYWRD